MKKCMPRYLVLLFLTTSVAPVRVLFFDSVYWVDVLMMCWLQVPARRTNPAEQRTELFNVVTDPMQRTPLHDLQTEIRMIKAMVGDDGTIDRSVLIVILFLTANVNSGAVDGFQ